MKIALAQIAPHLGDVKKNQQRHQEYIERAVDDEADLVVFPELSLTGYSLKDLVPEVALNIEKDKFIDQLTKLSRRIEIVLGFVEEKDRGLFYNSAVYFSEGKILHVHRKVFLPTYGMFEELKFFGQGKNFHTFSTPFGKTGLMICYDFLHYGSSYLLFVGGADIMIVISAAPGRGFSETETFASSHMWELMGETISRFSTAFVVYCNRVGFEDGKSFGGGSFIYSPSGELLTKASYIEEELILSDLDLEEVRKIRKKWPYRRDEKPEVICEALKRIIGRYED
jgi:predicted amidohydrolase